MATNYYKPSSKLGLLKPFLTIIYPQLWHGRKMFGFTSPLCTPPTLKGRIAPGPGTPGGGETYRFEALAEIPSVLPRISKASDRSLASLYVIV